MFMVELDAKDNFLSLFTVINEKIPVIALKFTRLWMSKVKFSVTSVHRQVAVHVRTRVKRQSVLASNMAASMSPAIIKRIKNYR